ncbi:MAG: FtsQ-type POTRA domain-containing protein [Candidatus Caldatribacterium sp.]|uniref:cell division protein FtsQ/DivIB n=1 Tax=Candidatus Caldatribacterium sp. TaxID=2282143 RepID=UPI0029969ADF|nr:FtsQ-type POTRA domain-containing protein [Candidatus Caldatribacterium sp.]MCX7729819.1 FtsQ-type POTRA domain-containing protein [Candidatus Caldatribacterium sp.]MDW8080454.1 FtsQ-type POTRA domain-containing protein [Candidatus Calescibacterium sp.]
MTTIEVTGCQSLRPEYVRDILGVQEGTITLFAVRSWELEHRLERIPQVKEARVEKVFPHTLRIVVVERKPEIRVEGKGEPFCLDRDGVKVPCSLASSDDLVRVFLRSQEGGILSEVLDLVAVWEKEFDFPLVEVEAFNERLFILKLQNGIVIKCEGASNLRKKAVLLKSYLRDVRIKSLKVRGFDLRPGEDMVIAPGEGEGF